jgi:AsmA protein
MSASSITKIVWAFAGAAVLALIFVLVLPLIASNMIGGARIVRELSERTGYRVTVGEAPEIAVWPRFRAVLSDVKLRDWADYGVVVMSVERVDVDLSPLAILGGFADFSAINLQRPVFAVVRSDGRYHLPPSTGAGRLEQAIDRTAAEEIPNQDAMGRIKVFDGQIVDIADGTEIASALTGTAEWTMTNSPAALNATAIWRGDPVAVSMSIAAPMALIRGGTSNLSFAIQSAQANVSFNGSASEFASPRFEGALEASSPALAKALDWLDIHIGPAANLGKVSLTGQTIGTADHLAVSQAVVTVHDMPGTGALDFTLSNGIPNVAGTLAFDRFDLQPVFATAGTQGDNSTSDLKFTNQFGVDLRLSAAEAVAFGQSMREVAATVQVRPGFAVFDISDATVMGGTLQLGLRGEHKAVGDTAELRMSAIDIDVAPLLKLLGLNADAIKSKATFTASLTGPVSRPAVFRRTMTGSIEGSLAGGSIDNFDLAKLTGQADDTGFFPLNALGGSSTTLEGADFKADLSAGVARLHDTRVETPGASIEIDGIIPYVGRSLALTGHVFSKTPGEAVPGGELFFVGGSWDAPFVTSATARQQDN